MRAAHGNDPDWSLNELLKLIDETGFPFPLTLLVDGVFIRGTAVSVDDWADHLDETMDRMLAGTADSIAANEPPLTSVDDLASSRVTAGDVEKWRSEWPQKGWRQLVDKRRATAADTRRRLEEVAGDEPASLSSLPDDLGELAVELELPKLALTIRDAVLFGFGLGGGPVNLPYIRVVIRHISAWCPGAWEIKAPGA
jgi:hypothetical protein